MLRATLIAAILSATSVSIAQPAAPEMPPSATPPTPPPTEPPSKLFGIGYKLGDGIGIFGADIVINVLPHIAIDLYAAFVPVSSGTTGDDATEYAMAPAIQYELRTGQRSTPYAAVGFQYAHLTLDNVSASATGGFANIGYEWKWRSGLGIQLGGGIQYLTKADAMSSTTSVTIGGKANPNLEFGIRYMFF